MENLNETEVGIMCGELIKTLPLSNILKLDKAVGVLSKNYEVQKALGEELKQYFEAADVCHRLADTDSHQVRYDLNDTGIIIQGPIRKENKFTCKVMEFYRNIYSNVPIVLSTWKGEVDNETRGIAERNDIFILESTLPSIRGVGNVNYQIKSSFEGAKFLKKYTNATFALKCRTDQWFSRQDFLVYLRSLLFLYPARDRKMKNRLVTFWGGGMPFFFQDFFTFGNLDDIYNLYDIPYENGEADYFKKHVKRFHRMNLCIHKSRLSIKKNKFKYDKNLWKKHSRFISKFMCAEMYLFETFYNKYIQPIDPEHIFDQCMEFFKYYVVVPEKMYVYWPKYEKFRLKFIPGNTNEQQRNWMDFILSGRDNFRAKVVSGLSNRRLVISGRELWDKGNFLFLLSSLYYKHFLSQNINLLRNMCFQNRERELFLETFLRLEQDRRLSFFVVKDKHEIWLHYTSFIKHKKSNLFSVATLNNNLSWPGADRVNNYALAAFIRLLDDDIFYSVEMSAKEKSIAYALAEATGYQKNNSTDEIIRFAVKRRSLEGQNISLAVNNAMDEICAVGGKIIKVLDTIEV